MFLNIQEQIKSLKNQNLSDYEIMDYINNHIDSTQKDSVIDLVMDCVKDAKSLRYVKNRLKDII